MVKAISLKILKLHYGGKSIGNNIILEVEGKSFPEQIIKLGSDFIYDQLIEEFRGVSQAFQVPMRVKIIERDFLWNDVGDIHESLIIDPQSLPQIFTFKVKVQEKNKLSFSKPTAEFTITLEAKEFNPIYPKPKPYINSLKKDYNRFDTEIAEAVGVWNDEFLNQEYPPVFPLDPSLAKAMIYVESVMGYGRQTSYPSYPDVMQVADPNNDAIYALKNIYNPNPGKKKMGTEYEVVNLKPKALEYKEANGDSPNQSIHWGVRYLYHIAQENHDNNGVWSRTWKNWEEIFPKYNGGGDKDYKKKVLEIYNQGTISIKNSKSVLWNAVKIFLVGFATYTSLAGLQYLDNIELPKQSANVFSAPTAVLDDYWISGFDLRNKILDVHRREDSEEEISDIQVEKLYNSPLFFDIVENEKDWWEYFEIGRIENGKIVWLKVKNWPEEEYMQNSILSARWIELKGFNEPVLEVYSTTHMGNGEVYLFKVNYDGYYLIFHTFAVDYHYDYIWDPENYNKYGYGTCSETYMGDKLFTNYSDLNNDGFSDITLSGIIDLTCKQEEQDKDGNYPEVKVLESPIKRIYIWNNKNNTWDEKSNKSL